MATTTYRRILLTPAEMTELDDGQDWYGPGDECWLGGELDTPSVRAGFAVTFDLCVNGVTHDNWTTLDELPATIRERLVNSTD